MFCLVCGLNVRLAIISIQLVLFDDFSSYFLNAYDYKTFKPKLARTRQTQHAIAKCGHPSAHARGFGHALRYCRAKAVLPKLRAGLGLVPSALTYRVRQLEDALDVLLFDRSVTPGRAHALRAKSWSAKASASWRT